MVRSGRKRLTAGQLDHQAGETSDVQTCAGKLALLYQQATIVGCALLEGAGFFALVAYMIAGHLAALIVAVVMLIGIAMHVPLGERLSLWVEFQLRAMEEEIHFSAPK